MAGSKNPKRHTGRIRKLRKRPDGTYSAGLWSDRHALLLGQIASYWVLVEEKMIEILRDLLGGGKEVPARQIFRSMVSNDARRKLLLTLLEQAPINRDKDGFYDDVIEKFQRLSRRRNTYIHGLWQTYQDNRTAYLSARSTDEFHFIDIRKVPVSELEATVRDMDALYRQIQNRIKQG
jgi:hypothetical protein